jgi:hypothetical protein
MIFTDSDPTWLKGSGSGSTKHCSQGEKNVQRAGKQLAKDSSTCIGFFNVIHSPEKGKRRGLKFF